MKKVIRASRNAGKNSPSAQSAKATKKASEETREHLSVEQLCRLQQTIEATEKTIRECNSSDPDLVVAEQLALASIERLKARIQRALGDREPQQNETPERAEVFPAMCEGALEEECSTLVAAERRDLATKLERWAAQLRLSAELMDRAGCTLGEPGELVLPDAQLAERLRGKSPAHALKLRVTFLEWAEQIRIALRLDTKPEARTQKVERELFVWRS